MIHLYHGNGKGKTTAAIGLCIRALGAGKRVAFFQCMKGSETSEFTILKGLPGIKILRNKEDFGFYKSMDSDEKKQIKQMHNDNLECAISLVDTGQCDLLVMDEITYPLVWDLIEKQKVYRLLEQKTDDLEIVLTGRNPDERLIEYADYITEMRCVRHPHEKGIAARKGIEF